MALKTSKKVPSDIPTLIVATVCGAILLGLVALVLLGVVRYTDSLRHREESVAEKTEPVAKVVLAPVTPPKEESKKDPSPAKSSKAIIAATEKIFASVAKKDPEPPPAYTPKKEEPKVVVEEPKKSDTVQVSIVPPESSFYKIEKLKVEMEFELRKMRREGGKRIDLLFGQVTKLDKEYKWALNAPYYKTPHYSKKQIAVMKENRDNRYREWQEAVDEEAAKVRLKQVWYLDQIRQLSETEYRGAVPWGMAPAMPARAVPAKTPAPAPARFPVPGGVHF